MAGLFRINGSALVGLNYDPSRSIWPGGQGSQGRTVSGRLRSLARSVVTLAWEYAIESTDWDVILSFWKGLKSGGMKVTSITVPNEEGGNLATLWTTYTATDAKGIWPMRPYGEQTDVRVVNVSWTFQNVKADVD